MKSNKKTDNLLSYPPLLLLAMLAPLVLLATGCHPYFNMFYNAEEAYQIAQREHAKVMRVFPDSIVVTPPAAAAAKYDRAIEKSLKMMEVYPKDRKNQDKAHYLMGRASFYKKDFPVSVGRMRDLQTLYPESPLVPRSHIYVAKAHIMMDNLAIAEEILLDLLRDHPQLNRKQEITMLLVEIAMRRGGRSQALELLAGIRLSGLPIEKRIEVILRMADLNFELRQYGRALDLLRAAPRSKKHPYLMYRIDRSMYFCYDATDSFDTALEHLWSMQKNRRYHEQRYEIMYYRGVTLRRMGRFDEALVLFEDIKRMCAGKAAAAGKPDTLSLCGRTAYEMAVIYQELGKFDLAQEAFEEASKMQGLPEAGKIAGRLWALKRLKELRTPDSSGKVSAEARYTVAELFRFELEIPDSAYIYYMELAAAADSLRPRALLSAAFVARYQKGDAKGADSLLNTVIRDYEGTEYAKRAQIEMDAEVTVVTLREKAEREFRAAEALLENEPVEAVKAFYEIYRQYPALDIAPRSLHAAAWHTGSALGRNRAAMTLYEELCEKYPESEYCRKSASPRLSIARDSIEVRRKRRDAAAVDTAGVNGAPKGGADSDDLLDADGGKAAPAPADSSGSQGRL